MLGLATATAVAAAIAAAPSHHASSHLLRPSPALLGCFAASACSTQDNLQQVVQQAVARAKHADAQDLPAVVHQLLMLSTRGCRELILQARAGPLLDCVLQGAWRAAEQRL